MTQADWDLIHVLWTWFCQATEGGRLQCPRRCWGGCLVLFYSCSVLWKDRVSPFHISSLFLNWYERCVSLKFSDSMGGKIPTIICHRMKICTYCKGSMSDTDHDLFLDSILPIASCLRVFEGGGWEARNSSAI